MALERERRSALSVGVAVFIAGGVLLGVEIAASRVLAPYFGNSLFVWGALIGVVLAGLSTGYYVGGSLADRMPTPRLLLGVIGLSALLVLAIPFVDGWVLEQVVDWDPGPRLSPLVAAVILFGLPSIVLGSVSPIAVRLTARSLERLGRTAGSLYALSTAGSIAGTFATAFWLIPELGTDQVLAVGALGLVIAAAAVAAGQGLVLELAVALALTGASVGAVVSLAPESGGRLEGAAARNWSPVYRTRADPNPTTAADAASASESSGFDVVEAKDTRYHRMVVAEDADTRYLRFDNSFQSAMFKADPFRTRFTYTDYLSLGLAYRPGAERVLFIGLGGGSAPKRMWRDFPRLSLQVVELDPEVVKAAYRWFELPRNERLDVDADDGRRWLNRHEDERWDVIVLDAFYSDSIPFHLATREFMELVQRRLAPGGVLVTNMIGAVTGQQSKLLRSLVRTYRSVFPTVALHPVFEDGDGRDSTETRNVIMVATEGAEPTKAFLTERWNQLREDSRGAPDLRGAIANRWERFVPTRDVPILTDDYAPTDALLLVF
jgi:spermidine synthase